MSQGSAPGERRGGRAAGTPNRRTTELREKLEALDADPAISLVKLARAAEADGNQGLAADCWGKLLGYIQPRPKPVEMFPDEVVELSRALLQTRIEATAETLNQPGIAERLRRASERLAVNISVDTGIGRAPDDPTGDVQVAFAASPAATPAPAPPPVSRPAASPAPASSPAGPVVPPRPVPPPQILPRAPRPERPQTVAVDYDPLNQTSDFTRNPYSADPNGFIFGRD